MFNLGTMICEMDLRQNVQYQKLNLFLPFKGDDERLSYGRYLGLAARELDAKAWDEFQMGVLQLLLKHRRATRLRQATKLQQQRLDQQGQSGQESIAPTSAPDTTTDSPASSTGLTTPSTDSPW